MWDNAWRVGTTPLFGLQNVEDARLRAYVLAYFWCSFLGGVVAQLLIMPLWGRRGGVRGARIVLHDWLLFLRLPSVVGSGSRGSLVTVLAGTSIYGCCVIVSAPANSHVGAAF